MFLQNGGDLISGSSHQPKPFQGLLDSSLSIVQFCNGRVSIIIRDCPSPQTGVSQHQKTLCKIFGSLLQKFSNNGASLLFLCKKFFFLGI